MKESAMIGARIRALRLERKMTLKELGEASGLSVGFLSQLERGMSSVAIDSLAVLAGVLQASLASFFEMEEEKEPFSPILRGYERHALPVSPQIIQYVLSRDVSGASLLPRLFELLPQPDGGQEDIEMYSHEGEEFTYVLEGIVTVFLGGEKHTLYPGDSLHIPSSRPHNWINLTHMPAKLLSVNYPNPLAI